MATTFITYRKPASWPPAKTHSTQEAAEAASRIAIDQAEQGESVLLLTGSQDKWTKQSKISGRPSALRVEQRTCGFQGLASTIAEFSGSLNDASSKEWARGFRHRPLVVLNDADYFLNDDGENQFTCGAGQLAVSRLTEIERALSKHGGSLFVLAELHEEETWKRVAKANHWRSYHLADFLRLGDQSKDLTAAVIHGQDAIPPEEFPYGPVQGTKTALSGALLLDGKKQHRRVLMKVRSGSIWAKKIHERLTEVWFRSEHEFQRVKSELSKQEINPPL